MKGRSEWRQKVAWIIATTLGWGVGLWYITPLTKREFAGATPAGGLALIGFVFVGLLSGAIGGMVVWVGQSSALRTLSHRNMDSVSWIALTAGGSALAWSLGGNVGLYASFSIDFPPAEAFTMSEQGEPMLGDLIARAAVVGLSVGLVLGVFQGWA